MPGATKEVLIFDKALGGLADVVGWYTPKTGLLIRNEETGVLTAVKNRKLTSIGGIGLNNLVPDDPADPPAILADRVNGRPSISFNGSQRLFFDGLLPAGDFAAAFLFRTPTPASTKIIAGSANLAGRRAIYLTNSSGVINLVSTFGTAGATAANAITPVPALTWTAAFVSHDNAAHEASVNINGAAWTSVVNAAADATNQSFSIGGYYDSAPAGFEGEIADFVIFKRPLKGAANALYYDRSKRYLRARYRQVIADT
jgi:hypothetical protein